jgi:hypothetical protein
VAGWVVLALAATVAFLGAAVWVFRGRRAAPEPSVTAVAPPASAVEPPRELSVEITSAPSGARLVRDRDGALLGVTPLHQSWPRGPGVEALRLELEGYRPVPLVVPLDRDVRLALPLDRLPAAPQSRRSARPARSGRHRPAALPAPAPPTPAPPVPTPPSDPPHEPVPI